MTSVLDRDLSCTSIQTGWSVSIAGAQSEAGLPPWAMSTSLGQQILARAATWVQYFVVVARTT